MITAASTDVLTNMVLKPLANWRYDKPYNIR